MKTENDELKYAQEINRELARAARIIWFSVGICITVLVLGLLFLMFK